MNTITRNGRRRHTVTDCDTYGRRLWWGYGYRFKKSYESTLATLVLPLVEWTECRAGVQAIVARQNWSARALRHVLTMSTTITALANALLSITGTTMTALARHKGPLRQVGGRTRIIVFIRYVRILIQLPCPRVMFYYVILEKRSYTHKDTWLHTLISYVLLLVQITPACITITDILWWLLTHFLQGFKTSDP